MEPILNRFVRHSTAADELKDQHGTSTVLVRFDRVYGNLVCYPANDAAVLLASIAGTKTLLPRTLVAARGLGLQVTAASSSDETLQSFLGVGHG